MNKKGHGDGSVFKHNSGLWCAQFSRNGKRYSVYAKTKEEAQSKLKEAVSKIDINLKSDNLLFADWLNYWLEFYVKPFVKFSTYSGYESAANVHIIPEIGEIKMRDLSESAFQHFFNVKAYGSRTSENDNGLSAKTLRNIYNILRLCLKAAVKDGVIEQNVIRNISLPIPEKSKKRVLSSEEQEKLIAVIMNDRNISSFGILLMLFTGVRCGELLALKWDDIDDTTKSIRVNKALVRLPNIKNDKPAQTALTTVPVRERVVPLVDVTFNLLNLYKNKQREAMTEKGLCLNSDTFIIANRNFSAFEPKGYERIVKRIGQKSGCVLNNSHILRDTFAANCLASGMGIPMVSYLLGDEQASETLKMYGYLLSENEQEHNDDSDIPFSGTVRGEDGGE